MVDHAYAMVVGRPANSKERELAVEFLGPNPDADRLAMLFQTLFQSLDFRYLK